MLYEKKKKNSDISIRIIFDLFQSNLLILKYLNFNLYDNQNFLEKIKKLESIGIEIVYCNFLSTGLMHKKTFIIDHKIAYVGASAIGDGYFGNKLFWDKYEHILYSDSKEFNIKDFNDNVFSNVDYLSDEGPEYCDFGIKIVGESVAYIQASFLQKWMFYNQNTILDKGIDDTVFINTYFPIINSNYYAPIKYINSIPKGINEMYNTVFSFLSKAKKNIYIEFCYIHYPKDLFNLLIEMAKKGIKICISLNSLEVIDVKYSWYYTRNEYYTLLSHENIKVYETVYFSHRKCIVIDDEYTFISSGQLEIFSSNLAWDDIVLVHDIKLSMDIINRVFNKPIKENKLIEITKDTLTKETFLFKFKIKLISFGFNLIINIIELYKYIT